MLVALNSDGHRCLSVDTDKTDAPFYCPECDEEVVLKKGLRKIHHYAHKPPVNCKYGNGEGELHYRVKLEIYQALKNYPQCEKCEIERASLKEVRPDVSLEIRGFRVAIEIQDSKISIDEINRRIKAYEKHNVYLVWVLPQNQPKVVKPSVHDANFEDYFICSPSDWQKYLHVMYFSRVYYWQYGAFVKPIHFDVYSYWMHSGNRVEDSGLENTRWGQENLDDANYGGYEKKSPSKKIAVALKSIDTKQDTIIHLADDFIPVIKKESVFRDKRYPSAKIWKDKLSKWWK